MITLGVTVTITSDGKLLVDSLVDIPKGEYKAVIVLEDNPISDNLHNSVKNAQAIFRKYIPPTRKLSEELIQERREETLNE
ncbi:MAG: hypothetical protein ACKPEO_20105 [Sphaerospermopsis kisseleviana]|uniref:Uncharacterized protein n=1 Tax=Sphaerospermopsis kisseleviana CS-549 TaxID=3021783 RepID=A0ABT4ZXT1_9CYAN|nr:hypothetical protein [Sphaerospermopsis kisseleviana]MDB9443891.1 hypothetical protein [Sphaerospermopsis kisseleviana CS-549]BAZ82993.1 hypothetical protein NIES73_42760 [Sphaerospermopsis kisseleviana NIES-73]